MNQDTLSYVIIALFMLNALWLAYCGNYTQAAYWGFAAGINVCVVIGMK